MEIHFIKKEKIKNFYGLVADLVKEKFELNFYPQIEADDKGKPFFPQLDNVHFSISHSGEFWAVAVDDKPIGLDIEVKSKVERNYFDIAERFFTFEEYKYVKKYGSIGFLRIWVRKEACLKLTGQGLAGGLKSFSVIKNMRLIRKVPMGYVGEVNLGKDVIAACCSEENWKKNDVIIRENG